MGAKSTVEQIDEALASNKAVGPNGEVRTVTERTARRVWIAAGGRCTICNKYLASDETTGEDVSIGQLAHIVGWSTAPGSPRGSADLDSALRNEAANVMLLCYDQHKVIDHKSLWEKYDPDTLRAMKRKHERRIRALTAMGRDRATTVLRVVGSIHDQAVDLTEAQVRDALFEQGRFPDWALDGVDEYEVDLRAVPGEREGTPLYWASARAHLEERLGRLRTMVANGRVTHISVFPLARIPVLVVLGTMLDDTVPTDLYRKQRDGAEGWGWTAGATDLDFGFTKRQQGTDLSKVALLVSISGSVDQSRLPWEIDDTVTIYELSPTSILPAPDIIRTAPSLEAFNRAWRLLLAQVEANHRGVEAIPTFSAVPAVVAVSMGRHLMRAAQPPLEIFDRVTASNTYQYALSTARSNR